MNRHSMSVSFGGSPEKMESVHVYRNDDEETVGKRAFR
jgi:hypothetical protein